MYQGRFEPARPSREPRRRGGKGRMTMMVLSTLLLLALAIGGTVAWLTTNTEGITNTFTPSNVTCRVDENFDGKVKTNVNVTNTGDIYAFVRVKLVSYRTNDNGDHIGGKADLPTFTLGTNWVEYGGYYYYKLPVAPNGGKPASYLTESMTLTETYADADGGHQSIDVMAEAIQCQPAQAVKDAWGNDFSIDSNGNLVVPMSGN